MTSREQFEAWFQQKYKVTADTMKVMQIKVELAWESWQASRASVDIEILNEPFIAIKKDATNYDFYNAGIESAKRAITNAGIKVKDC